MRIKIILQNHETFIPKNPRCYLWLPKGIVKNNL